MRAAIMMRYRVDRASAASRGDRGRDVVEGAWRRFLTVVPGYARGVGAAPDAHVCSARAQL
ncbi:hypothetical protein GCM10009532_20460 [Microbacterium aurantiacum]